MKLNETTKRWLTSSLITFFTGFTICLLANWDGITLESFTSGTIGGIIFLSVRSGVKAVLEIWLSYWTKQE